HQDQIAALHLFLGAVQSRRRDRFAKEHSGWLEYAAAATVGRQRLQRDLIQRQHFAATHAHHLAHVAVKLDNITTTRRRVKVVHVLRNDAVQQAELFESCQAEMPGVGEGGLEFSKLFHHPPDLAWVTTERLDGGVFFWIVAIPESTRVAKRGDATLS